MSKSDNGAQPSTYLYRFCRQIPLFVLFMIYCIVPGFIRSGDVGMNLSHLLMLLGGSLIFGVAATSIAAINSFAKWCIATVASLWYAAEWLTFFICHSRISSATVPLIFQSDKNESTEFLSLPMIQYAFLLTFFVFSASLIVYFALKYFWRIKYLTTRLYNKITRNYRNRVTFFSILMGGLVVSLSVNLVIIKQSSSSYAISSPMHLIYSVIYKTYTAHKLDLNDFVRVQCQAPVFAPDNKEITIVYVIGESHNRHRAGTYGYFLPTDPFIKSLRNDSGLVILRDVVSAQATTMYTWPRMLSLGLMDGAIPFEQSPLLPAVMKKAGFHVSLFNNQALNDSKPMQFSNNFFISTVGIRNQCFDEINNKLERYDRDFVQHYPVPQHPLSFTIYHLKGQHTNPAGRFPKSEAKFKPSDYQHISQYTNRQRQQMADYDNATLMVDNTLRSIIHQLQNRNAVLVYIPDHGETVYDCNDSYGRMSEVIITDDMTEAQRLHELANIKTQYELPGYIWFSPEYRRQFPNRVDALRRNAGKPIINTDITHTILELAGVRTPAFQPNASLLRPTPVRRERMLKANHDLPYDRLRPEVDALKTIY